MSLLISIAVLTPLVGAITVVLRRKAQNLALTDALEKDDLEGYRTIQAKCPRIRTLQARQYALYMSVFKNARRIAFHLLDSGVRPKPPYTRENPDPVMCACVMQGRQDILKRLLDAGAHPNSRTSDGETPLEVMVRFGSDEKAALLIAAGADSRVTHTDIHGAPEVANRNGRTEGVALLQEAQQKPQPVSGKSKTPPLDQPLNAKHSVCVVLSEERHARCGEEQIVFPSATELMGDLTLKASYGPLGARDYANPHFLTAIFDFEFAGRKFRYTDFISQWDLWAPDGTHVETTTDVFTDHTGQLDGMMDDRRDWSYVLPDGTEYTNRLKYTSCQFWCMVKTTALFIQCRYYDAHSNVANMVTIWYTRPLEKLLLLKETQLFLDAEGKPEDFWLHNGLSTILTEI